MYKLKKFYRQFNYLLSIIYYKIRGNQFIYPDFISNEDFTEPNLEKPTSQLVTFSQFKSEIYYNWCKILNEEPLMHRKQWEFIYVLEVLKQKGKLNNGISGLGFGVGTEPLPAVFASNGCSILATDQDLDQARMQGWTNSLQHSTNVAMLKYKDITTLETLEKKVEFKALDMLKIPKELNNSFDFVWSCCALEHLGSIKNGLDFILNSLDCLKVGGVAVHTTEFNLSSNKQTLYSGDTVLFRKKDIQYLILEAEKRGFYVYPVNYNPGTSKIDMHIDLPPFKSTPDRIHEKLLYVYVTTSIGLIFERKEN
jgi:hypothetical protein